MRNIAAFFLLRTCTISEWLLHHSTPPRGTLTVHCCQNEQTWSFNGAAMENLKWPPLVEFLSLRAHECDSFLLTRRARKVDFNMAASSTNLNAGSSGHAHPSSSHEQQDGPVDGSTLQIIDPAKMISDREELERQVVALDAECKEYHSKRKASTSLLQKVTTRSPKSKKVDAERDGNLDQMQDLLVHKATACYERTKLLYAIDYDRIARVFSQRVRYEKYDIDIQTSGEPWEYALKILPALYDADLGRRTIILEHLWRHIPGHAKDLRKDAESVHKKRRSNKDAATTTTQSGESDEELTALIRRYIHLSDKVMEYRHVAKQIDQEARKDLIPTEELVRVRKDYLKIINLLNEMGASIKYRLDEDSFEELEKGVCSLM